MCVYDKWRKKIMKIAFQKLIQDRLYLCRMLRTFHPCSTLPLLLAFWAIVETTLKIAAPSSLWRLLLPTTTTGRFAAKRAYKQVKGKIKPNQSVPKFLLLSCHICLSLPDKKGVCHLPTPSVPTHPHQDGHKSSSDQPYDQPRLPSAHCEASW